MALTFHDRVALVTGATSGIGREIALAFGRAGARVVVVGRSVERGEDTAAAIVAAGGEARFVAADVSVARAVGDMIRLAVAAYGRVDCAVNGAGIEGAYGPTADQDEDVFDRVIAVNLKGTWLCMQAELRQMVAQGSGTIVNIASINGLRAGAGFSPYCASKHGVVGLTQSAAIEYSQAGIRVNAVCAGAFPTPMLGRVFAAVSPGAPERVADRYTALIPLGRLGRPSEVADAVLWLCSDGASYVTGHCLAIDGGLLAR